MTNRIQQQYEQFYVEALDAAEPNEVAIDVGINSEVHHFVEKNFYLCGFNYLRFKMVGKNRELKPYAGRKAYGGGFYIDINKIGQRGNGDFTIQEQAFSKTAQWLDRQGYDVYHESRLD